MSETKHSPAPWKFDKIPGIPDSHEYVLDANGVVLAVLYTDIPSEKLQANAKLMAAAPELLAGLKKSLAYVKMALANNHPLVHELERLIIKAGGEL